MKLSHVHFHSVKKSDGERKEEKTKQSRIRNSKLYVTSEQREVHVGKDVDMRSFYTTISSRKAMKARKNDTSTSFFSTQLRFLLCMCMYVPAFCLNYYIKDCA